MIPDYQTIMLPVLELVADGKEYQLNDHHFPTIDPKNPYKLNTEESELIEKLKFSFLNSNRVKVKIR